LISLYRFIINNFICSHTRPSHSQTSRIISTILSLGILYPMSPFHLVCVRFSPPLKMHDVLLRSFQNLTCPWYWYLLKGERRDKMGKWLKKTTVRSQDLWRMLQPNTHSFPSNCSRHKITVDRRYSDTPPVLVHHSHRIRSSHILEMEIHLHQQGEEPSNNLDRPRGFPEVFNLCSTITLGVERRRRRGGWVNIKHTLLHTFSYTFRRNRPSGRP
jgi:hypothetical protein